jgi:2-polyprenyl-3-methyl-5-hydroxy-6-metoxy-1,4-benzoquinol methylase
MNTSERTKHWETIYNTKQLCEVSWYQPSPNESLQFVREFNISKTAKIIDVGGGDSFFVDKLLEQGYENITVLDISETAINRAKKRLGEKSEMVTWIVSDIVDFKPSQVYDFWHDRAAFHFLTNEEDINTYISLIKSYVNGVLVIGTFSENGPKKCSGIEIKQYTEKSMVEKLSDYFNKIKCISINHTTPFDTIQNFIFCSFKKLVSEN